MDADYKPEPSLSRERDYTEALAELEREIAVRKRVFARWVTEGKLSRVDAADRYERLKACLKYVTPPGETCKEIA